ncbi:MAG: PKD domain-containing protein [Planctomycetota bacterium]|nr:PKD domain-containing protein [Planctomycetota bacterium]
MKGFEDSQRAARGVALWSALALLAGATVTAPAFAEESTDVPGVDNRPRLFEKLRLTPYCFSEDVTESQLEDLLERYNLRPPTFTDYDERYFTSGSVWTGDLSIGGSGRAARTRLTYSFPNDGVTWGDPGAPGPNGLGNSLTTLFGAANLDRGRELVRQGLASWRRFGGLTYDEVADDNVAFNFSTTRTSSRGDIRIGGIALGTTGVLAYNYFPTSGGDMTINLSYFTGGSFNSSSNNYRFFRNVVAHEHGHGLGYIHPVPCDQTKLMEPFASAAFDLLQIDDRRAAARNYGDRFSGNQSSATAKDFGNLTSPVLKSIIERNLSTNGVVGANNTDEDWFKFTLGSAQPVVITVTPTGGVYNNGEQTTDCNGNVIIVEALRAGNLNVELIASNGTTVLLTAASANTGFAETINAGTLAAGTYFVRVFDVGPNAHQVVQLYDLTLRVASATAPPQAIAGINKRIAANTNCFFIGDVNSVANEGTLNAASYDWDLDGDGTFETLDTPQPNRQYPFGGVIPVTLRLTDSNGQVAFDTINVTVIGPPPAPPGPFSLVSPSAGQTQLPRLPTLAWSLSNFATNYDVVVDNNSDFSSPEFAASTSLTSITLTGTPLQAATTYFWKVTATNILGSAVSSPASSSFTTISLPPVTFNLLTPADGATGVPLQTFFTWDSAERGESYTIQIDNDADFSSIEFENTSVNTSYNVPVALTPGATYYWRVFANNPNGSTVSTPAVRSFTTLLSPPGSFNLLTPADGAFIGTFTPTLDWADALNADSYSLEVDDQLNFSSPVIDVSNVLASSYPVPSGILQNNTRYYWRVTADNSVGSTPSNPTTFTFAVIVNTCCPGNADKAPGQVNFSDVTSVLGNWGNNYPDGNGAGDADCNQVVNFGDVTSVLGNFGDPCN